MSLEAAKAALDFQIEAMIADHSATDTPLIRQSLTTEPLGFAAKVLFDEKVIGLMQKSARPVSSV